MQRLLTYIIFTVSLFSQANLKAQNITGVWEGIMSDERIQINIEQKKNELCGFTYDYVLRSRNDHCKAKFEGFYDPKKESWFISGTDFIENSGNHVLMIIQLWRDEEDGRNVLHGTVKLKSMFSSLFDGSSGETFMVRRVSKVPNKMPADVPLCFPPPPKKQTSTPVPKTNTPAPKPIVPKTIVPKPVAPKPKTTQPPTAKPPATAPVKIDTLKVQPPISKTPVVIKKENSPALRRMAERKQTEQSRLEIDVDRLNLKLYDNGVVDNDTVSVFYNGRLLVSKQRLSEEAIELNVELDEGKTIHEFTLFADNLGSIPPNTALIVVTAGKKRFELRSKASMEENAVLIFEYKKKE